MTEFAWWSVLFGLVFFAPALAGFCLRSVERWQILQLNFAATVVPFLWIVAVLTVLGEKHGMGD